MISSSPYHQLGNTTSETQRGPGKESTHPPPAGQCRGTIRRAGSGAALPRAQGRGKEESRLRPSRDPGSCPRGRTHRASWRGRAQIRVLSRAGLSTYWLYHSGQLLTCSSLSFHICKMRTLIPTLLCGAQMRDNQGHLAWHSANPQRKVPISRGLRFSRACLG